MHNHQGNSGRLGKCACTQYGSLHRTWEAGLQSYCDLYVLVRPNIAGTALAGVVEVVVE
jgi:hypothetical protein